VPNIARPGFSIAATGILRLTTIAYITKAQGNQSFGILAGPVVKLSVKNYALRRVYVSSP
jgi:hypothetical protein